jgi:hypothetical protein
MRISRSSAFPILRLVCCAAGLAAAACGGEPRVYGQNPEAVEPTPVLQIRIDPKSFQGRTVVLEGEIVNVDPEMGASFILEDGTGEIFVDLEGGRQFTVPRDLGGSKAIVQGIVSAEIVEEPYLIGHGVRVP